MTNPIATAAQFAAEEEVRQMWSLPQTQAARAHVAQLWRVAHGTDVPDGLMEQFDGAMDAWVSNYLFKAAAMNGELVRNFMPPYCWQGHDVPDARMGGDNPDNCYRLAGIAPRGRYRLTGRLRPDRPAHASFTLVENWGTSVTVQTLEMAKLEAAEDGSFTITIDDRPANGRMNHMTSNPRVKFLFIRDSMMDWARETPLDLHIERLDSLGIARSLEERLDEALRRVREDVPLYYWFFRLSAGHAINTIPQPVRTATFGGLVIQSTGLGRLHLKDDEAAIIRFDPAGAAYNSLQTANWWYQSIDSHRLQTGLSLAQTIPNADNTVTTVVSTQDPGIHNWVDTGGFKDLLPMIRWQGLSPEQVREGPRLWIDVVPFGQLDRYLPKDIARVDAAGREAQVEARRAAWDRRTTA